MKSDSPWDQTYIYDLHNQVMSLGGGYWANFKVRRVTVTANYPHGIKYSLTLHRRGGHRVLGYDNAHLPENLKGWKKPDGSALTDRDHRHWRDQEADPYTFVSPGKLLEDFWADVDRMLKEEGIE